MTNSKKTRESEKVLELEGGRAVRIQVTAKQVKKKSPFHYSWSFSFLGKRGASPLNMPSNKAPWPKQDGKKGYQTWAKDQGLTEAEVIQLTNKVCTMATTASAWV